MKKCALPAGVGVVCVMMSSTVFGQTDGSMSGPPMDVSMTASRTTTTKVEEAPVKPSDHQTVVGKIGIGLLGGDIVDLSPDNDKAKEEGLPIIGARYWLDSEMAIQVGIGLLWTGGTTKVDPADAVDDPSLIGFALQAGVPFALVSSGSFTFEIIPHADFVYGKYDLNNKTKTTVETLGFGAGVNAGAEIQFGFIGIPELALTATVGARYRYGWAKEANDGTQVKKVAASAVEFGSSGDPWDIFTSSIAAMYYF